MAVRGGAGGTASAAAINATNALLLEAARATLPGTSTLTAAQVALLNGLATLPGAGNLSALANYLAVLGAFFAGAGARQTVFNNVFRAALTATGLGTNNSIRNRLPVSPVGSSGKVVVTFTSFVDCSFTHCAIGVWDGTPSTCRTTGIPVELKFKGVSGFTFTGVTGPPNNKFITSDPVSLAFNIGDRLVVICDYGASGAGSTTLPNPNATDCALTLQSGSSYNSAVDLPGFFFADLAIAQVTSVDTTDQTPGLSADGNPTREMFANLAGAGGLFADAKMLLYALGGNTDQVTLFSLAAMPGAGSGDAAGQTYRNVVPAAGRGITSVRVTLSNGAHGNGATIDNAGVGVWAGSSADTVAVPTPITFTGSSSVTIPNILNATVTSDWITISTQNNSSGRLVIALDINSTGTQNLANAVSAPSSAFVSYNKAATDSYNLTTVSGLTQHNTDIYVVSKVEVMTVQFDGTSSFSVTGNLLESGAANFNGASTWSSSAVLLETAASVWGGDSSSLSASAKLLEIGQATFPGAGDFSASAKLIEVAASSYAGTGGLSASSFSLLSALCSLAGVGGLSADSFRGLAALCSMAGSGGLSGNTFLLEAARALYTGAGDFSSSANLIEQGNASLVGASGFTSSAILLLKAQSVFAGAGVLNAFGTALLKGVSALSGAGTLTASEIQLLTADVALSGNSGLAAGPFLIEFAEASMSGIGDFSADAVRGLLASASFQGSGGLSARAILLEAIAAQLKGEGFVAADAIKIAGLSVVFASAVFAGSGGLSARATLRLIAQAQMHATSVLRATGGLIKFVQADFAGAGNFSATVHTLKFATAALSGVGALTADTLHYKAARATLVGAGNFSVSTFLLLNAQARLTGQSAFTSSALNLMIATASFTGDASLAATANLIMFAYANYEGVGGGFNPHAILRKSAIADHLETSFWHTSATHSVQAARSAVEFSATSASVSKSVVTHIEEEITSTSIESEINE